MATNTTPKTEKMTQRKVIEWALSQPAIPADVAEKFKAMLAALDKKATAEKKPTAKQTENEAVRAALVEFINDNMDGDGFTCGDLIKTCPAVEGKTPQYVSAILRQAILAKELSKGTVKRRTYFAPFGVYPEATDGEGE